ncbi:hypothetical protein AVEN_65639-1 [Araneus ventricosus]|uniref:Mos1 transposase HTH domain-containing protein n=1 Tax=Araneus ventricosus TaxID=182803 RepID=A0A4Y2J0B8_ARAVE|nr:hypothetical protein AVEN_65639-1 [Araneus ventricosus]
MSRLVANWSLVERRILIHFLWATKVSACETHRQIVDVYGGLAMSMKCCRFFESGSKTLCPRPHTARQTQYLRQIFKWKVCSHLPYSPDMTPSGSNK